MTEVLRHPGARPRCTVCHGLGLQVVREGELAKARPCRCVGACPLCAGSGFVAVGTGFRAPRKRCDCARVDARGRLFDDAAIPGRYAESTLSSFDPKRGAMPAFMAVNSYVKGWRSGSDNRGLVLWGKVGRGKTHLMIALLRELILRHGVSARFVEFSHLLADLKSSFERGGTAGLIEPLAQVDVLAIDELGKGRNTEFEGTVLDELVTRRYNAARTVLATTNFEPRAPSGLMVPNLAEDEAHRAEPALVDRVSERVYSRLREMCDFMPVGGEDYREVLRTDRARRP
jgi:DNA replication protein DnaC